MSNLITHEYVGKVLVLTLNRAERKNALSFALLSALQSALSSPLKDDTLAIVLHGAGGCFSAGGDFTELTGTSEDIAVDNAIGAVTSAIRAAPLPVIAAIDGPCMGAGFDLAMSCDIRIASSTARFQVPATRLGLLYNPTAIKRLFDLLGRDAVMQMLVIGKHFNAQAALAGGIVSELIEDDNCLDSATQLGNSTHENDPEAVKATKGLLNALERDDFDPDHWEAVRQKLLASPARQAAVNKARDRIVNKNC